VCTGGEVQVAATRCRPDGAEDNGIADLPAGELQVGSPHTGHNREPADHVTEKRNVQRPVVHLGRERLVHPRSRIDTSACATRSQAVLRSREPAPLVRDIGAVANSWRAAYAQPALPPDLWNADALPHVRDVRLGRPGSSSQCGWKEPSGVGFLSRTETGVLSV
jgi:hypothetical protein